jgi:hypothetical protein
MNLHPSSTEIGWGRGTAPLPQAPSPKTKLGRLHKSLDTPESESSMPITTSAYSPSAFISERLRPIGKMPPALALRITITDGTAV